MNTKLRRALVLTPNLVVLGAFVWAVEHYWGWGRLFAPWRHLAPSLAVLAIVGMLVSYILRAARIYLAERDIPRGQFLQSLRLVLISNVFNLLLPMRSGEVSFPILMRRWFGTHVGHATGTLLWLRLLDLHVLAAIGVVCASAGWLGDSSGIADWALAIAALCVAAPGVAYALRGRIGAWTAAHPGRLAGLLGKMLQGLPRQLRGLGRDIALTWLAWGVKLASLGIVLAHLAKLPLALGVLGAIGGDLSTVLPIHAPGGFGTYEAGVLVLLAPAHAPTPELLAAAVNLHLLLLTTALVAGATAWLAPRPRR